MNYFKDKEVFCRQEAKTSWDIPTYWDLTNVYEKQSEIILWPIADLDCLHWQTFLNTQYL